MAKPKVNRKPEEDSAFEDLQDYLMNNLCTPGSHIEEPMNEEDREEEAGEK